MSEVGIIDVLSNHGDLGFTVDLSVNKVDLVENDPPLTGAAGAQLFFQAQDQYIIEAYAFCLPYQFGQAEFDNGGTGRPAVVQLAWEDDIGNGAFLTEIGYAGQMKLADPNVWYETNIFVPCPAVRKHFIRLKAMQMQISMFNAPAALDEEELNATFFLKVRHTLPLIL